MTRSFSTTLFVLAAATFVAAAILNRSRLLADEQVAVLAASDVTGLAPGVPVRLNGYEVGRVRGIVAQSWLPPDFRVTLALQSDVRLAASVTAEIEPGLVGGAGEVRLLQGASTEPMAAGTVLAATRVASLPERASDTLGEVDERLQKSDQTFEKIDATLDAAKTTFNQVGSAVEEARPALRQGARQLAEVAESASRVTARTEALLAPDGEVVQTLEATRAELAALHDLMGDYDPDESAEVRAMLDDMGGLLAETSNMATRLREHPIRSMFKGMPPPDAPRSTAPASPASTPPPPPARP